MLNKADQFTKIHDFARAYGSLCWNLSKVIPRKDLPRIYTMCLPVKNKDGSDTTRLTEGLKDLYQSRDDIVHEVFKAPARRVDNEITRLETNVNMLKMHSVLLTAKALADVTVSCTRGTCKRQKPAEVLGQL